MSTHEGEVKKNTEVKDEGEKKKSTQVKDDEEIKRRGRITTKDIQRQQLEKLMAEPDKLVDIPEPEKQWKPEDPPEFVRFYMGSSAGAGSEVFHVYRHLRRSEMMRQQWINETAETEDNDVKFMLRLAEKKLEAEEKTAKKRAKRLRRKQRQKEKSLTKEKSQTEKKEEEEEEEEEKDEEELRDNKDDDAFDNPFVIGGR